MSEISLNVTHLECHSNPPGDNALKASHLHVDTLLQNKVSNSRWGQRRTAVAPFTNMV